MTSPAPKLTISRDRLLSIAYFSVGIQTEAGAAPYTRVVNAGGASGLSVGVAQNDFKQNPQTAAPYASALFSWSNGQGKTYSFTEQEFTSALKSASLSVDMQAAAKDFGSSLAGATWIHQNLDLPHFEAGVAAVQKVFETDYGQALLLQGQHVEEFAAFSLKVYNQYGPGASGANVSTLRSPGFGALVEYVTNGSVTLRDNSSNVGATETVTATEPGEFSIGDLERFVQKYASTRAVFNRAVADGPIYALTSGDLYEDILNSSTPLADSLRRVEAGGNFSPSAQESNPDLAVTRALFGSSTKQVQDALNVVQNVETEVVQRVEVRLGGYPATLWFDPVTGRTAIVYKADGSGFIVGEDNNASFASSSVVKQGGSSMLLVGSGDNAISFVQADLPIRNLAVPVAADESLPVVQGHWEEQPVYSIDMGLPIGTQWAWVDGPALSSTNSLTAGSSSKAAPIDHYSTGGTYLSRDGLSAILPSGNTVNAGVGGRVTLNEDGSVTVMRVATGYSQEAGGKVYDISRVDSNGDASGHTQVQILPDPTAPDDRSRDITIQQGARRPMVFASEDGSTVSTVDVVYQVGKGWTEQSSGETVVDVLTWRQFPDIGSSGFPLKGWETGHPNVDPLEGGMGGTALGPTDGPNRGEAPARDSRDARAYGPGDAANGLDLQSDLDTERDFKIADIATPELANNFAPSGSATLGGTYGYGKLGDFDILPVGQDGTSRLLVNADGDIAGELNTLPDGTLQLKNLVGESAYILGAKVLTQDQYEQVQAEQQAAQAASAIGLMNSIISLQHWDAMSDLQRVAAVTTIYNSLDTINGGALPGNLGSAASALGLISALESGDTASALYSGLYLVESLTSTAATATTAAIPGLVSETLGGQFLPALGFVMALDSGNPVAIAASGLSLLSSLTVIGPWGMVAGAVISLLGGLFGNDDIPMSEGAAHAQWNAAGQLEIVTDQNEHDGGPTAEGWMRALAEGLQAELTRYTDAQGNPLYGLVPALLPTLGFKYDPDGMNYESAVGHLYLSWVDEAGVTQTRYYDGAGNRNDGSGETLAGDFMKHAMDAIGPAWAVQTTLQHWQAGQGLHLPAVRASLPQETADGLHQQMQVLTLALPAFSPLRQSLVDIDADGYLEQTNWVAANEAMLAIDADGDGFIGAGELLNLGEGEAALNSVRWLDADSDGRLDAADPAFAALRLWMDANGDGRSTGEARTLAQAGITAIDFAANPPRVDYADGTSQTLTARMLTGNTLGVAYQLTQGGVLEISEQADGSGKAVLSAVNTRAFDGQAAHMHGGEQTHVTAGDARLVSTGAATVPSASASTRAATTVAQGDARLSSSTPAATSTGTQSLRTATTADVRDNRAVFVPADAAQDKAIDVTARMVRGMESATGALAAWAAMGLAAGATTGAAAAVAGERGDAWAAAKAEVAGLGALSASRDALAMSSSSDVVSRSTAAVVETSSSVQFTREQREQEVQADHLASVASPSSSPAMADSRIEWQDNVVVRSEPGIAPSDHAAFEAQLISGAAQSVAGTTPPAQFSSTPSLAHPKVAGEFVVATEDIGLRLAPAVLLANDRASDGSALSIVSVQGAAHGRVSLDAQGQVVFVPDANYHGMAGFAYTVSDPYGLKTTAWASLDVAAANDAPVALGESATGDEDTSLVFAVTDLLANDSDVDTATDGGTLHLVRVGAAQHGSVSLLPDGRIRFVPEPNYNGPAAFSYWVADPTGAESVATVQLTLRPVNDLPVVQGEVIDGQEDTTLRIAPGLLLVNDTDVDTATNGQVLTIDAVGAAQHGQVVLQPDGRIDFMPDEDFFGRASFAYRVCDGAGGLVWATAFVDVDPVNDAPTVHGETLSAEEDVALQIDAALLLANDTDKDSPHAGLRIVSVGGATHGRISLEPSGALRFVPDADFNGTARFDYVVGDGAGGLTTGTATIEVAPVNDAPRLAGERITLDEDTQVRFTAAALLANDVDVDDAHGSLSITRVSGATHGSVALVAGEIVFTPDLNYNGPASFTYTVADPQGATSEATVTLDFTPVNDAPVVNGEAFTGRKDTAYTFTSAALLANDSDVEDPAGLRIAAVGNASHGTVTLLPDGGVCFTPQAGYTGTASFDYTVEDPQGGQSIATTTIDFSRINTPPLATDDSFIGYEDVAFRITSAQLLVNDSDADDARSRLKITSVADASHGTVSLDVNGTVTFMPAADYFGPATFRYQVTDTEGASTWATAFLSVQGVNDAPVIEDVWYGRPIYGYEVMSGEAEGNGAQTAEVTSLQRAMELLAPENVRNRFATHLLDQDGHLVSPVYYRSGELKPIAFTLIDATRSAGTGEGDGGVMSFDDDSRSNGRVIAYDPDGDSSQLTYSIAQSPVHGHVWVNQYLASSYDPAIDHTLAPIRAPFEFVQMTPEKGAWQYISHRGDGYHGADDFAIRVTDAQGASADQRVAATHMSWPIVGGGGCPIVVDLAGNGIDLIRPEDSNVFMDINGDGWRDQIGWASTSDAVLAYDANHDGRVDIDHEVSFVDYLPGARTDLEGLAAFDTNRDGKLDAADGKWKDFGLFQDKNGNGVQDEGEFVSLDAAGLQSLSLLREGTPVLDHGNVVFGTSAVAWADGHSTRAGDVMFAGNNVPLPAAAVVALEMASAPGVTDLAQVDDSCRIALQFTHAAALPPAGETPAIAFTPSGVDVHADAWVAAAVAATSALSQAGAAA